MESALVVLAAEACEKQFIPWWVKMCVGFALILLGITIAALKSVDKIDLSTIVPLVDEFVPYVFMGVGLLFLLFMGY